MKKIKPIEIEYFWCPYCFEKSLESKKCDNQYCISNNPGPSPEREKSYEKQIQNSKRQFCRVRGPDTQMVVAILDAVMVERVGSKYK